MNHAFAFSVQTNVSFSFQEAKKLFPAKISQPSSRIAAKLERSSANTHHTQLTTRAHLSTNTRKRMHKLN